MRVHSRSPAKNITKGMIQPQWLTQYPVLPGVPSEAATNFQDADNGNNQTCGHAHNRQTQNNTDK